jgi:3,4-dihydroxy 2-butanone 4-phosphate synthase/GTP cyclohydrolase II
VLRRSGHTEAAIDLARLAGFYPAGVLVEILNTDGTMARLPQLLEIAELHDLKIISIRDLIAYRMERERIVEQLEKVTIDTTFGVFDVIPFRQITSQDIHLAFVKGTLTSKPTLVRMHSAAETGDVLGILFDDYGQQLSNSLKMIAEEGNGVLVYLRHSEHPEAVLEKLKIYKTEHDLTPQETQQRNIGVGAQILNALGIEKIRLITNHPRSRVGLLGFGLEIVETVHCPV